MNETGLVRTRLAELEALIERGLNTFVEVGRALMETRDSRLYRESYDNFENYCRERRQMSRFYAYRLMDAAEVSDALLPIGNIPSTESQARELAPVLKDSGPDAVREVWVRAVENSETGQPTAAEVRMAVHFSSNSVEWSTPPEIIERAQKTFGGTRLRPLLESWPEADCAGASALHEGT